ncbi:uncharacterized protein LOC144449570 [Glandiceps talaboti]
MPKKKAVVLPCQSQQGLCLFCGRTDEDDLWCGKLFINKENGITVHYYCLLFASGLSQRGEDKEGIQGFLIQDILKEYRRGARLNCNYCLKKGATIGCVVPSCKLKFHFPCGRENYTLSQFFGHFSSFCQDHRPQQKIFFKIKKNSKCPICLCTVESTCNYNDALKTPCCKKTWIHRSCVQRQALSAGYYFFRCPLCNDKDQFQEEMLQFGIYIPEQDASWELEENAFQDLLERYNHCDVSNCICPDGRQYSKTRGNWEILVCCTCGSSGSHAKCSGMKNTTSPWTCEDCKVTINQVKTGSKNKTPTPTPRPPVMWRLSNPRLSTPLRWPRSPATSRAITLSPPTPGTDEVIEITELPQVLNSPVLSYRLKSSDNDNDDSDDDDTRRDHTMPRLSMCKKLRSQKSLFSSETSRDDNNVSACWSTDSDFDSEPPKLTMVKNESAVKTENFNDHSSVANQQCTSSSCSITIKTDPDDVRETNNMPGQPTKRTPKLLRKMLFGVSKLEAKSAKEDDVIVICDTDDDEESINSKTLSQHEKDKKSPETVKPALLHPKSSRNIGHDNGKAVKSSNGIVDLISLSSDGDETDDGSHAREKTAPSEATSNNSIQVLEKKFVKSTTRMSMKAKPHQLQTHRKPHLCQKHQYYFSNIIKKQQDSIVKPMNGESHCQPAVDDMDQSGDDIIITECKLSPKCKNRWKRKLRCLRHNSPHKKMKQDKHNGAKCDNSGVITTVS